jgi:DNA polymerase lambda
MTNFKASILKELTKLANDKKAKKEIFRHRAYIKAIQSIKEYENEISTIDDLNKISGLAKGSIRTKIEELINTGEIEQVKSITEQSKITETLTNIYGVGPKKANELVNKYNVSSIEDLKYCKNKDILNDKQKIGLKYYDDLLKRIPLKEMEKHEKFIIDFIKSIDTNNDLIYEIVGSYRRKAKNSGDIDVLFTIKDDKLEDTKQTPLLFNNIIKNLEDDKYITETLAKGGKKFMGLCKLPRHRTHRRLDMIYTNYTNYAFTLLYFTGSGQFNIEMRNHALSLGYSLSEYGLKKKGKLINDTFETEQDIFKFLGIKYIEPFERKAGILKDLIIKE